MFGLRMNNLGGEIMEFMSTYYGFFLSGAGNTLIITFFTIILGTISGIILALMRISNKKVLNILSVSYVEFIRGTPLLVQIFLIFYGLPILGITIPDIELLGGDFSRFVSGIIALSINSSAYISEIIRAGIQSINKGQMEASRSLGLGYYASMKLVILPQAFKNVLPALGNEVVTIIKGSSIISVIGIPELMYKADTIRGITYKPFLPLIIAAIIYFIMTFTMSNIIRKIEIKMES